MAQEKARFQVGKQFGPDHRRPDLIGRKAAFLAAEKQGDPCTVYVFNGFAQHWELMVDRSMPDRDRLGHAAHLRNVLRVVRMKPMQREVPAGKPGYRWAPGWLVPTNTGYEYPPVHRYDAIKRAKEIYGDDAICIFE